MRGSGIVIVLGLGLGLVGPSAGWNVVEAQTVTAAPEKKRQGAGKTAKQSDKSAAEAVDPEVAIEKARSLLGQGKHDAAAELAQQVLGAASKTPRNTARALAVRGEARLKSGRVAEALSDLDSALWVKGGLAGAERDAATAARVEARKQAGVAVPADGAGSASVVAAAPERAPQRRGGAAKPEPAQETAAASSPGIGSFFSNLFTGGKPSGGNGAQTAALPVDTGDRAAALSSSEPQRAEDAPTGKRAERRAAPAPVPRAAALTVDPPASQTAAGTYVLQLGAVRTRQEAQAMAEKARKMHADVFGSRTISVNEAVYGNMGRFYRAQISAFKSPVESEALCASLRQKGVDCMVAQR